MEITKELERDTSQLSDSSKMLSDAVKMPKYEDPFGKTDEGRQRCLRYSRVMGYYQNFNNFNIGKKQEFSERKNFKEPKEK